jgi:hypothetical protein
LIARDHVLPGAGAIAGGQMADQLGSKQGSSLGRTTNQGQRDGGVAGHQPLPGWAEPREKGVNRSCGAVTVAQQR